jgi:type IV pilus assembly protein PilC
MPTYSYVARDAMGKEVRAVAEAETEKVLARQLRERGLFIRSVTRARSRAAASNAPASKRSFSIPFVGRVGGRDLALFCRQFSTMINAGVSLVRCLSVLEDQSTNARLKVIIREIQVGVESGETLSRTLTRYPRVFSNLFVGLVRAGEVGGVLDETLNRLATFLEEDQKLKRKVKAAMTYPVLVMVFALAIVIGLVTFILPKFMELFTAFDVDLPGSTAFLVASSHFITNYWWICILVVVGVSVSFSYYTRTRMGKRHWDLVKLKMPVFGKLNHKIALARFSRTLSTLMISGVPILQAMETVAGSIDNEIISGAILNARTAIREGERIGDPLQKSGLFPQMVIQMIAIGEETGSLDAMLMKVADFYEAEVDATLQSLTAALEPIMIVFLGGVVGFIVISMFMPLIAIIGKLSE